MNRSDEASEDRISRLCTALGRITASLDIETVLAKVVDGTRALEGAHLGNFYLIEKEGVEEFTGEDVSVQAVRNFVKKLRRKIGNDPAQPSYIHNVRGVGYTMPKPGEA